MAPSVPARRRWVPRREPATQAPSPPRRSLPPAAIAEAACPRTSTSTEPAEGHGLAHDPFNSIVGPRPIGWISSVDREGRRNLAPYSFFNAFNYHPPIVGFCSVGYKDSVRNVEATGEFGWNLATFPLAEAMNASCAAVAPGVDEFGLAGLTPVDSKLIAAPRVGESPVSFECKLTQMLQAGRAPMGEPVDSWMMFGEVVAVHIAKALLEGRHLRHGRRRADPARWRCR